MTRAGRMALAAAAAVLAGLSGFGAAGAQEISSVALDHIGLRGGRVHEVWVVVLDERGMPVLDLAQDRFVVSVDGRPAELLKSMPPARERALAEVTLLVDPALETAASPGLRVGAFSVDQVLPAGARLRVGVLTEGWPGATARGEALTRALDRLTARGGLGAQARLYDGLYRELERAGGARGRGGRAVLALTRGVDEGSVHEALEVLTLVETPGSRVPIGVMLFDPDHATEVAQLRQLAARSGGALATVPELAALGTVVPQLLARAGGAYHLRFRPRDWDERAATHHLGVTVDVAGRSRSATSAYAAADVVIPPAWRDPRIWLTLAALGLVLAVLFLALRPRRLFVLVVDNGAERGCSYEVYGLPVSIGGLSGNDLTFPEPRMSRNHAIIARRGGRIEIVDQNSENGTFVNGQRIERQALRHGDRISLGGVIDLSFLTRK